MPQPGATEQPVTEAALREVQAILDEEVQRLPEKLRAPFVLCCLEGKSKAEAARLLGWKEGTVSGRLAQARERLRDRLTRRGVSLPAALCALAVTGEATASLPAAVVTATTQAAIRFLANGGEGSSAILATQALQGMASGKIKATALVMLSLLAASAIGYQMPANRGRPQNETEQAAKEEKTEDRKPKTDLHGDPLPQGALVRMGTVRFRHPSLMVPLLAFLPDGKIVTSGDDGMERIWDPTTGKELSKWHGHDSGMRGGITVSADGKLLATSDYRRIYLRDLVTGKELRRIPSEGSFQSMDRALAFSPDGRLLAGGVGYQQDAAGKVTFPIALWDVATGKELRTIVGHERDRHWLAFTPDSRTLIAVDEHMSNIRFWDPVTGKELRRLELQKGDSVRALALSPDGKVLAAGGARLVRGAQKYEATVWLWDAATGRKMRQLPGKGFEVRSLAFSPDGRTLANRDEGALRFWDVATGKEIRRIEGTNAHAAYMAFSPNGKTLATVARQTIHLWDVATGKELSKRHGHTEIVHAMAYSSDGNWLAAANSGGDYSIQIWDTATGKPLHVLQGHTSYVRGVSFSPDGKTIVSGGGDNTIRLWNAAAGKEVRTLSILPEHDPEHGKWGHQVVAMRLTTDGRTVYARSMGFDKEGQYTVSAWETATGKRLFQHLEDGPSDFGATFSADGRFLVTERGLVTDVATGKRLQALPGLERVYYPCVLSPDGKVAAFICRDDVRKSDDSVSRFSIHLFELATGNASRA
jgi:WD40 repeat protein